MIKVVAAQNLYTKGEMLPSRATSTPSLQRIMMLIKSLFGIATIESNEYTTIPKDLMLIKSLYVTYT